MRTRFAIVAVIFALSMNSSMTAIMDDCVATLSPLYQGNCISDYAVVATAAVELGWCLKDKAKYEKIKLSAQDLICNCKDCHTIKGNGCMGGSAEKALNYIKDGKIVGGSYTDFGAQVKTIDASGPVNYTDCLNYWSKVCDPNQETTCVLTAYDPKSTTFCPTQCNRKTEKTVADSKITKVLNNAPTKLTSATSIKAALATNRPVVGTMELFEDMAFFLGSNKVYVHSNGQSLGVVTVLFTAHNVDTATGLKYWTVLVPWDKKYTDGIAGQTLRVIAEINHLNMENEAWEIRVSSA